MGFEQDIFYILKRLLAENSGCMATLDDYGVLCRLFDEKIYQSETDRYDSILCIGGEIRHPKVKNITYKEFIKTDTDIVKKYSLVVFNNAQKLTYYRNMQTRKFMQMNFRQKLLLLYPPERIYQEGECVFPDKPDRIVYCAKKLKCFGADTIQDVYRKYFSKHGGVDTRNYLVKGNPNQRRLYSLYIRIQEIYVRYNEEAGNGIHFPLSPSKIQNQKDCPGAYWIKSEDIQRYPAASRRGTLKHKYAERFIKQHIARKGIGTFDEIEDEINQVTLQNVFCLNYIKHCVELVNKCEFFGAEELLKSEKFPGLGGTVDFWAYDQDENVLHVVDFKTGRIAQEVKNNVQLQLYALLLFENKKHLFNTKTITKLTIFSKNEKNFQIINNKHLTDFKNWFILYLDRVKRAKKNPVLYLSDTCTSFFCAAKSYHRIQQETLEEQI